MKAAVTLLAFQLCISAAWAQAPSNSVAKEKSVQADQNDRAIIYAGKAYNEPEYQRLVSKLPKMTSYLQTMGVKFSAKWHPLHGAASPKIEVMLDRNGKVIKAEIWESSLNTALDKEAMSVISSMNYGPLPSEWSYDSFEMVLDLENLPGAEKLRNNLPYYRLIADGNKSLDSGDFKRAIEKFKQALELHYFNQEYLTTSKLVKAYNSYGLQIKDNNPNLALEQFISAVGCLYDSPALGNAKSVFKKLGKDPTSEKDWLGLAEYYLSNFKYDEGVGAYNVAYATFYEKKKEEARAKNQLAGSGPRAMFIHQPIPDWTLYKYLGQGGLAYRLRLFHKIEEYWKQPKGYDHAEVKFDFAVRPDGSVESIEVKEWSNDGYVSDEVPKDLSTAVTRALKAATPFEQFHCLPTSHYSYKLGKKNPLYGVNTSDWSVPTKEHIYGPNTFEVQRARYLRKLERQILLNWTQDLIIRAVSVQFYINRSGHISELRIQKSSGSETNDQAALSLLKKSAPFESFPDGFPFQCYELRVDVYFMENRELKCLTPIESKAAPTQTSGSNPSPERLDLSSDAYTKRLMRKIVSNWPIDKDLSGLAVYFTVHPDGHISRLRLKESSGSTDLDKAALEIIRNSTPFEPLPFGLYPQNSFYFRFDQLRKFRANNP